MLLIDVSHLQNKVSIRGQTINAKVETFKGRFQSDLACHLALSLFFENFFRLYGSYYKRIIIIYYH